jgi:uncharacterized protein (TIGR03435 family)
MRPMDHDGSAGRGAGVSYSVGRFRTAVLAHRLCPTRSRAYTTVQTMVYRLEVKQAVRRAKKIGNLSRLVGSMVVDKTGPDGNFDWTLEFAPDPNPTGRGDLPQPPPGVGPETPPSDGPSKNRPRTRPD